MERLMWYLAGILLFYTVKMEFFDIETKLWEDIALIIMALVVMWWGSRKQSEEENTTKAT